MAKRAVKPGKDGYPKKDSKPRGRPRQHPLAGMEDVRIDDLDEAAAALAEIRDQMNQLRTDEAGHLRNALKLMRQHKRTTWRASGVELFRVPGEEKLRVRTSKEKATAESEDDDEEHVEAIAAGDELRPGVEAE